MNLDDGFSEQATALSTPVNNSDPPVPVKTHQAIALSYEKLSLTLRFYF